VAKMKAAAEGLALRTFRDEDGRELVDLPGAPLPSAETQAPVRFLPTWDAVLLVHARRTQILPEAYRSLVFSTRTPHSVGTFLGQCAEFCGESHANMRLRVVVQSAAAFEAWAARQVESRAVDSTAALQVAGLEAFRRIRDPGQHTCIACHTIAGVSGGVAGPNLTHVGSRQTIAGGTLPNDSAGLARWLRNAPGEKPGSLMPKIALSDDEIAALVAYLRSRQ